MNFGGGHKCPRCGKSVYFAEEVIAIGEHWHKTCFLCANEDCNKRLNTGSCTEHDGEAYCTNCYKRLFGPRGYGYGVGAGTLSMDSSTSSTIGGGNGSVSSSSSSPSSPIPPSNHYPSPQPQQQQQQPQQQYPQKTGFESSYSNSIHNPLRLSNSQNQHIIDRQVSNGKLFGSGGEKCARCNKTVYLAEKMIAAGKSWHKNGCFTCSHCNKRLESGSLCERESHIFCKGCYARNYGPKGYGYGVGAGTLQSEVFN